MIRLPRLLQLLISLFFPHRTRRDEAVRAELQAGQPFDLPPGGKGQRQMSTERVLTNTQAFTLNFKPLKANGQAATVDGKPVWSVEFQNGDLFDVDVALDGMSALVRPHAGAAVPGHTDIHVTVTADADLDADEFRPVVAVMDLSLTLVAAEAQTAILELGDITELSGEPATPATEDDGA